MVDGRAPLSVQLAAMPLQGSLAEAGAAPGIRCSRCGAAVNGTCHTRTGYQVGYYVLHTGRTVEATVRRRDDEAPLTYRRLVEPAEVVSCPTCFATPAIRRLWLTFGDEETPAS
jgi:hypothetical protein